QDPVSVCDEKISRQNTENNGYEYAWDISGERTRLIYRQLTESSYSLSGNIPYILLHFFQTFLHIFRQFADDALQVPSGALKVFPEIGIHFRCLIQKGSGLLSNPYSQEIDRCYHQGQNPYDDQHRSMLSGHFQPPFQNPDKRICDHGDDPSDNKRHKELEESDSQKNAQDDPYQCYKKYQNALHIFF